MGVSPSRSGSRPLTAAQKQLDDALEAFAEQVQEAEERLHAGVRQAEATAHTEFGRHAAQAQGVYAASLQSAYRDHVRACVLTPAQVQAHLNVAQQAIWNYIHTQELEARQLRWTQRIRARRHLGAMRRSAQQWEPSCQ